ncbi:hypothetical protein Bbelb_091950 [Branchiostoma belcheri]|nr:hypothetical protein Bbelb_091950 [Branchiostoma belcheri]
MDVVDPADTDTDYTMDGDQKNKEVGSVCSSGGSNMLHRESEDETDMPLLMEVWDGSPEAAGPSSGSPAESTVSGVDGSHACETQPSDVIGTCQTADGSSSTLSDLQPDGVSKVKGSYTERSEKSSKHVSQSFSTKGGEYKDSSCKSGSLEIIDLTEEEEKLSASDNATQRLVCGTRDKNDCEESKKSKEHVAQKPSMTRRKLEDTSLQKSGALEVIDLTEEKELQEEDIPSVSGYTAQRDMHETRDKNHDSSTSSEVFRSSVEQCDLEQARPCMIDLTGHDATCDLDEEVAVILDKSLDPSVQNPTSSSCSTGYTVTISTSQPRITKQDSSFHAITEDPGTRSATDAAACSGSFDDASSRDTDAFVHTLLCREPGFVSSSSSRCSSPEWEELTALNEGGTVSFKETTPCSTEPSSYTPANEELDLGLNNYPTRVNPSASPYINPDKDLVKANDTQSENNNMERSASPRSLSGESTSKEKDEKKSGLQALLSLRIRDIISPISVSDSDETESTDKQNFPDNSPTVPCIVVDVDTGKANSTQGEDNNQEKMATPGPQPSEETMDNIAKNGKTSGMGTLLSFEIANKDAKETESTDKQNMAVQITVPGKCSYNSPTLPCSDPEEDKVNRTQVSEEDNQEKMASPRSGPSEELIHTKSRIQALLSLRMENTGVLDSKQDTESPEQQDCSGTAAPKDSKNEECRHQSLEQEVALVLANICDIINSTLGEEGSLVRLDDTSQKHKETQSGLEVQNHKVETVEQQPLKTEVALVRLDGTPQKHEETQSGLEVQNHKDETVEQQPLEQEVALVRVNGIPQKQEETQSGLEVQHHQDEKVEQQPLKQEVVLVMLDGNSQKQEETVSELETHHHKDEAVEQQEDTIGHHNLLSHVDTGIDNSTGVDIMELYEDGTVAFEAQSPGKDSSTIVNITLSPVQPRSPNKPPCSSQSAALCKTSSDVFEVDSTEDNRVDKQYVPTSYSETTPLKDRVNKVQNKDTEEVEKMDQGQDERAELPEQAVPHVSSRIAGNENSKEEIESQTLPELLQDDKKKAGKGNKEDSNNYGSCSQTLDMELQIEKPIHSCKEVRLLGEKDSEDASYTSDSSPTVQKIIDDTEESTKMAHCSSSEKITEVETTGTISGQFQSPIEQHQMKQEAVPLRENVETTVEAQQVDNSDSSPTNQMIIEDSSKISSSEERTEDESTETLSGQSPIKQNQKNHDAMPSKESVETAVEEKQVDSSDSSPAIQTIIEDSSKIARINSSEEQMEAETTETSQKKQDTVPLNKNVKNAFEEEQVDNDDSSQAIQTIIEDPEDFAKTASHNTSEESMAAETTGIVGSQGQSPIKQNQTENIETTVGVEEVDNNDSSPTSQMITEDPEDFANTVGHNSSQEQTEAETTGTVSGQGQSRPEQDQKKQDTVPSKENVKAAVEEEQDNTSTIQKIIENSSKLQDAVPSKENVETVTAVVEEDLQIDNSGSSTLNSPLCKDIDFSQLDDLSPNSSIGDAILDFVQQANIQGVLGEEDKSTERDPSECVKENQVQQLPVEFESCDAQSDANCGEKQKLQDSTSDNCGLNELMDEISQLCETRDCTLLQETEEQGSKEQHMHTGVRHCPVVSQTFDTEEKEESSEKSGTQGLDGFVRRADNINQNTCAGSSGEGQRSLDGRRGDVHGANVTSNRKENSSVTMATSRGSTMGQVSLWDLMDHQGPFIIYPSQGGGGEGVRIQSTQPAPASTTTDSPTVTQGMSRVGNAVYSALSAVNADCTGGQQDEDEPTTMLDLDTHTVTTSGSMVLRSGHATNADQCTAPRATANENPCAQQTEIENTTQISKTSGDSKDTEGETNEDCPSELDLQVGVMTRARARRLQQLLFLEEAASETATSTVSAPVPMTYSTDGQQAMQTEETNSVEPTVPQGGMDAVAMAMMCSGLEDDALEDVASGSEVARLVTPTVGQGSSLTREGEGSAACQIIHCIPGANVTQTINRAHPDLLPTVITSMSSLAGHHVTSLTIQEQEFLFLEEISYKVYNHTVSYVLSRCNLLQISRIRCKGQYLEFLRPYCRFIDRSVLPRCAQCGHEEQLRRRGRKRQAEATVSVNPEEHQAERLQEDAAAADVLQSDLGPDNLFPRGRMPQSSSWNPTLIGFCTDAACQTQDCSTEKSGQCLEKECEEPPRKRHCSSVVATACQTTEESEQLETAEKCPLMEQHSRVLGASEESSSLPAEGLRSSSRRRHESRSSVVTSTQSINLLAESSANPDEQEMTTFYITTKVVGTRLQKVNISVRNDKGEELAGTERSRDSEGEQVSSEDQGYSETIEETPVSPVEGLGSGRELEYSHGAEKDEEVTHSGISEFCSEEEQTEGCTTGSDSGVSTKTFDSIEKCNSSIESNVRPSFSSIEQAEAEAMIEGCAADCGGATKTMASNSSLESDASPSPVPCMHQDEEESYRAGEKLDSDVCKKRPEYDVTGDVDKDDMEDVLSIMQESGITVADKRKEVLYNTKEEAMQDMCLKLVMEDSDDVEEAEEGLGEVMSIMYESGIDLATSSETAFTTGEDTLQENLLCVNESVMEQSTSEMDMEDVTSIMEDSGISMAEDVMSESCTYHKANTRGMTEAENVGDVATLDQNKNKVVPSEKNIAKIDKTIEGYLEKEQNVEEELMKTAACQDDTWKCPNQNHETVAVEDQSAEILYTHQNGPKRIGHLVFDTEAMPSLSPIQAIVDRKLSYSDTKASCHEPSSSKGSETLDQAVEESNQTMECSPRSTLHSQRDKDAKLHSESSGPSSITPVRIPTSSSFQPCIPSENVMSKRSKSGLMPNCSVCLWDCSPLLVSHTSKGGAFTGWGYLYPHWCSSLRDDPCVYCPVCNAFYNVSAYLGHFHEKQGLVVHRGSYGLQMESRQATGAQKRQWNDFAKRHPAAIKGCATPQKRLLTATQRNVGKCRRKIAVRFTKVKGGKWTVSSTSKGCTEKDVSEDKASGTEQQHDNFAENTAALAAEQRPASCRTNQSASENTAAIVQEQQTASYRRSKYTAESTAAVAEEQQTASCSTNKNAAEDNTADVEEQETASCSTSKHSATEDTAAVAEGLQTASCSRRESVAADTQAASVDANHANGLPGPISSSEESGPSEGSSSFSSAVPKGKPRGKRSGGHPGGGQNAKIAKTSSDNGKNSPVLDGKPGGKRTGGRPGGNKTLPIREGKSKTEDKKFRQ